MINNEALVGFVQSLAWKRLYRVVLWLMLAMLVVLACVFLVGCATGDEPLDKQDTTRVETPDVAYPKDAEHQDVGAKLDVGGDADGDDVEGGADRDVLELSDTGSDGGLSEDAALDIDGSFGELDAAVEEDVEPDVDVPPAPCGGICTSSQVCENDACVDVCQRTGLECGAVIWSGTEVQCGGCSGTNACFENRCAAHYGYRAITAGFSHTCATLAQSGAVRCWGKNNFGQLGNNQLGTDSSRPVGVHVLSTGVSQLNTHTDHTCATHANGDVYCWGKNRTMQIGNGNATDMSVPKQSVGVVGAKKASVGGAHSCALLNDSRELRCWGEGGQGQLGTGTANNPVGSKTYVVLANQQTRLANNVEVSLGASHSCSLIADGSVYCWGFNLNGQVGSPNTMYTAATRVRDLDPVINLGVGRNHTCAVTQVGEVYCWGEGESGQLGNDALAHSRRPVKVDFLNPSVRIVRVVAGGKHTCAIDSERKAWCWGDNSRGQLGGEIGDALRKKPYPVANLTDILTISAGFEHTCAVRTSGHAYCWGSNESGQLGDGMKIERNRPVLVILD